MVAAVVLAAGQGKRMCSKTPKVLHKLAGRPMVHYLFDIAQQLHASETIAVISPHMDPAKVLGDFAVSTAVQEQPRGGGEAMRLGVEALSNLDQDVIVLYGDTPLVQLQTLEPVIAKKLQHYEECLIIVGMRPAEPGQYGRVLYDEAGAVTKIVEHCDATPEELQETLCNSGVIYGHGKLLQSLLQDLQPNNAQGEYYATDCVHLARDRGIPTYFIEADEADFCGVNDRAQLAAAEAVIQQRLRRQHMLAGVTMQDPESVFFSHDTELGKDVTVGANVVFGAGVRAEDDVNILPFCHIENTYLHPDVVVGPFARLRGGAVLQERAEIGNFVEVKNSNLGPGSKAKHLTYLGDSQLGKKVNVGAGTITCNYDGKSKSQTVLKDKVFVGSNSTLIAPVLVEEGAYIAAGSVVTDDVPGEALAIARGRQTNKTNWSAPGNSDTASQVTPNQPDSGYQENI